MLTQRVSSKGFEMYATAGSQLDKPLFIFFQRDAADGF